MNQVTAGTLIGRCFEAWSKNLGKLAVLASLPVVPIGLVAAAAGVDFAHHPGAGASPQASSLAMSLWFDAALIVVVLPVVAVEVGAVTYGVVQHLAGRSSDVGAMLRQGFRRMVPLALAGLLVAIATFAGLLFLIVPGIAIAVATSLTLPAVMVEGIGPREAIGRSVDLSRGARWPLLGALAALVAISIGVNIVGSAFAAFVPFAGVLVDLVLSLLFAPLPVVLSAVAYHDLRVAREGVDAAALAKALG